MKQVSVVSPRPQPSPRRVDAELEPGAEGVGSGRVRLGERDRRLREDERKVPLEPVAQALPLVADAVRARRDVDVHVVAAKLDGEAAQVVRPLVERATGSRGRSGRGASGR